MVIEGFLSLNAAPFIVGEVSKNWINGAPVDGSSDLISQMFERMIEFNRRRGYRLHSFQLHRLMTSPGELTETLIAVFEIA